MKKGTKLYPTEHVFDNEHKAKATGEFRNPRKGEWYLSGSIVAAYKAHQDLSSAYHIAKLVNVKRERCTRCEGTGHMLTVIE